MFIIDEIGKYNINLSKILQFLLVILKYLTLIIIFSTVFCFLISNIFEIDLIDNTKTLKYKNSRIHTIKRLSEREDKLVYLKTIVNYNKESLTKNKFIKDHFSQSIPCILRNIMKLNPYRLPWNIYYKKDNGKQQIKIKIYEFSNNHNSKNLSIDYKDMKNYLKSSEFIAIWKQELPYEVKNQIFLPKFLNFIKIAKIYIQQTEKYFISVPKKTEKEIFYCQIRGVQDLIIIPYLFTKNIYPNNKLLKSRMNFFNVDYSKNKDFQSSFRYNIQLKNGDCVYIPQYYWVQSRTNRDDREENTSIIFKLDDEFRYLSKAIEMVELNGY